MVQRYSFFLYIKKNVQKKSRSKLFFHTFVARIQKIYYK